MRIIRTLVLIFALHLFAHAESGTVRVSILSLLRPTNIRVTLIKPGFAELRGEGRRTQRILSGKTITISNSGNHQSLNCQGPCVTRIQIGQDMDRVYSGQFEFYFNNNTINIVLLIAREQLVASVLSSEMGESTQPEAIKAFAIVSRSFLDQNSRHPLQHADFCDTTHCQVFQNLEPSVRILDAVQQTRGLVLTYHDQPVIPFYSRACGGRTSTFQDAWGKSGTSYEFPSVSCPCVKTAELWKAALAKDEIRTLTGFAASKMVRDGNRIVISNQNSKMQFPLEIFRAKLGQTYGWKRLPGNQYEMKETQDGYLFEGKGQGHGVGFCQKGADLLAAKGLRFDEILSHYFPATEIRTK